MLVNLFRQKCLIPISKSMKSARLFKTILLVLTLIGVSSCERAVNEDRVKVSFNIPNDTVNRVRKGTASVLSDFSAGDVLNVFSSVSATSAAGSYPINCYMVVSSSANSSEAGFNTNYCHRDFANRLNFGEYVGLVYEGTSAYTQAELSVTVGSNRIFHLIGTHAFNEDECKSMSNYPKKSNMTKPYLLGTSNPVNLEVGVDAVVEITKLNMSTSPPTMYFDDCVFPDLSTPTALPLATSVTIDNPNFPWKAFRKVPNPGNFLCEALDVAVMNAGNLARVGRDTDFEIRIGSGSVADPIRPTFENYSDCISGSSIDSDFGIRENSSRVRRWIRTLSTDFTAPFSMYVKEANTVSTLTFEVENFFFHEYISLAIDDGIVVRHDAPARARMDACYEVNAKLVNLYGTSSNILNYSGNVMVSATSGVLIYPTGSNCTGGPITGVATGGSNSIAFAFKTPATSASDDFQIIYTQDTGMPVITNIVPKTVFSKGVLGPASYIKISGASVINYGSFGGGVRCIPLNIRIVSADGDPVSTASNTTLSLLNLLDGGLSLHTDSICSAAALTLSSTITLPGSDINGTTVYIRAPTGLSPGHHKFELIDRVDAQHLNGSFEFDLIDEQLH